jgi:molecular chaperone DnaK
MKDEAAANAEEDRKAKEVIDKLNAADSLIFQTEKQIKEYGDKIPAEKKEPIESALKELKDAYQSKNIEQIDGAMEKMNTAWQAASQDMYNASQQGPTDQQNQQQQQPNENPGGSDNVTDVDFEEVKEK